MTEQPQRRAPSIRARLVLYLLLPLVLLLVVSIWADHRTFVSPMYDMFDRALAHSAEALASHVQRNPDGSLYFEQDRPPPRPMAPFTRGRPFDGDDRPMPWMRLFSGTHEPFFFRISLPGERTLAGDASLPMPSGAPVNDLSFADAFYRNTYLRLVSYHTSVGSQAMVVTVGESTHRRDETVHRLDTVIGLSDGIQLALVLGLCLFGITIALRPIKRLREQIMRRPPQSLEPLPLAPVPAEVRPVVHSLNAMLMTVRDATLSQQHFLTNAAHQLRTPLTGLKAQLEVMANEAQDETQHERIERLREGVDRLAHTANQLLALARAEPSAHGPDDLVEVDLSALIETVADAMLDRALAAEIDLGAEASTVRVQGVYWLLHELLINLVDNAIRHTPRDGRITLRCGMSQGAAFLEVEDSGPGIPLNERDRVRQRFYRSTGSHGQSSGLGLAIVEEIARSHRARFGILDAYEGTGARMRIDFPPPQPGT